MGACHVISVFSTKGGVGKTLMATNLAVSLARDLHVKAALLDLLVSNADIPKMIGSSGVQLVQQPVTVESLPSILTDLQRTCAYVIIDVGAVISELAALAFERSNLILLITTPDAVCLDHTNRTIRLLGVLKFPLKMVKVVINRAESRGNFRSSEVKAAVEVGVIAEIPSDGRLVGYAVNRGVPLVMLEESGRIQHALKQLARWLAEHPEVFVEPFRIDRSKLPASPWPPVSVPTGSAQERMARDGESEDPMVGLKRRVHARLIESFDLKRLDLTALTLNNPVRARQLRERAEQLALELVAEERGLVVGKEARERLVKEIVDNALGLGPLEDLIADRTISDVLVNGKDQIYIETRGKLLLTDKRFISNEHLLTVIERIIAPLGRRIDESSPMVDARLPDGSRVNAIIPPLSIKGPLLSIRKFSSERLTMEDLMAFGTLTQEMAAFLRACVMARKSIIVSGGAGSGKTTLLNVLSSAIPAQERIVTIEDAAELRLHQEHWVPLEARPQNIEGRGMITIRHLFRNALRMRPDRIIIGECRGDETLDMLQAMNTGHEGSLTTLHANSPQDVVSRLDSLILMSDVDLPIRAIREQIASAIDLIVHTARLSDGTRKITYITEIAGMDAQTDLLFRDLFVFHHQGLGPQGEVLGAFKPTGQPPSFLDEIKTKGVALDEAMFHP